MSHDSIKYAHTPTATDNVWGVGLKNAKRQSRWTALFDVAQSISGLILGIFLFCHMAFTSSVNISKDLFANLIHTSGGYFIDGQDHAWMHVVFVGFIALVVIVHMFCALRRFPTSYRQFQQIRAHSRLVNHPDTTLWMVQLVTAFLLFIFVFPHLMTMLTNPHGLEVNAIGVHTYHNGLLYTFLFLVVTELHGMIGLYRLAVKWDIFSKSPDKNIIEQPFGDTRAGFRKTMLVVALLMIVCGTITIWTNYSNGKSLIDAHEGVVPAYQIQNSWYKSAE